MTSYELIDEIERFQNAFPPKGVLVKTVELAADLLNRLETSLEWRGGLYGPKTIWGVFRHMLNPGLEGERIETNPNRVLEDAGELLKQVRSRPLFAEIESVNRYLSKSNLVDRQFDDNTTLARSFVDFVSVYETFIERYAPDDTLALLKAARRLRIALNARREVFNQIKAALMSTPSINFDAQTEAITLVLYSPTQHLSKLVSKLNALTIIYAELCRVSNVSESANPLTAAKVESGSLWTKLVGESQVIKLMTDLIRSGVQFLHRQYTKEGKLSSVTTKIDIIETNILLEQRMRSLGYDTANMREDIQKAGAVIAKQTVVLLEGEGVLSLNGERFSVGEELEKQFLENSKTLLLPATGNSTDGEENNT
jgi:hypothetical protein